jgi:hypothetical protein
MLIQGVIESIITVNQMFAVLPFEGVDGTAISYNREKVLGDAQALEVGGTITANAPAEYDNVANGLTTLIADADVNGLVEATLSAENDQRSAAIASKAKTIGRLYQGMLINGDGTGNSFAGLTELCADSQKVDTTANGAALSFPILDSLISLVVDKDGVVDYFAMNTRTINQYFSLLRGLNGASINETVELPDGKTRVPHYRNVPILRNDYISTNVTKGTSTLTSSVFAGTLSDGTRKTGLSGLTARKAAGIQVIDVGEKETTDDHRWRIKWYCGLALFSEKGLSLADGITA